MQIYVIKVFQWKLTEDNIILLNLTLILYYLLKKSYLISLSRIILIFITNLTANKMKSLRIPKVSNIS